VNFSHYHALAQQNNAFTIDKNWTQGRSIFGGLSAALVLTHIEAKTDLTNKYLRTINVHFCGPIDADKPCQIQCTLLSEGKSISQVQGQLIQDGNVKTLIVACFGAQRRSSINVPINTLNPQIPPESALKTPFIKDVTPNFIQHMDVRLTSKNPPFSGSENATLNGWMRFADAPEPFSDAAMLALIDTWPPAVLGMLKDFAPASTVTWNIEFIQPRPDVKSNDFLYYECDVVQAGSGYAHTEGKIYHPDGQLLALSRQLVAVYDKVAGT
jgi:acyl-CoA thioesterase